MRLFRRKRAGEARDPDMILPPEGVPLRLKVAGLGVRTAAQIADVLITLTMAICILIVLGLLRLVAPHTLIAVGALMFFILRVPYYVLAELVWNGQTLGKRMMKIKVVAHDGGTLTTHAIVLRNLMKEAEVFLPGTLLLMLDQASPFSSLLALGWILLALAIPLFSPWRQRLGDLVAGTHVVHLPEPRLMPDLASVAAPRAVAEAPGFVFLAHQLDHYGAFELQTLETLLRAPAAGLMDAQARANYHKTQAAIVEKIRRRIGYADPVAPAEHEAFLRAFYNAQRAHLEQRQLFGERRADKHHKNQSLEGERTTLG